MHMRINCSLHNNIQVCDHFSNIARGGRRTKSHEGKGRPKGMTPKAVIEHIDEIAPEQLSTCSTTTHPSLVCPICMEVLQSPVELPCGQHVCSACCKKHIVFSGQTRCPCCYRCDLSNELPKTPTQVVRDLLVGSVILVHTEDM